MAPAFLQLRLLESLGAGLAPTLPHIARTAFPEREPFQLTLKLNVEASSSPDPKKSIPG